MEVFLVLNLLNVLITIIPLPGNLDLQVTKSALVDRKTFNMLLQTLERGPAEI